jgi:hypothetical protein
MRTALRASRSAALLLLTTALPLASCSSGSTSYCDAIRSAQQDWREAGASLQDPAAATRFVTTVKRIEESAPEEVRADWHSLLTLFERFTVEHPDLSSVTKQMQGFESAAKRIETHAKETCGVDLGH